MARSSGFTGYVVSAVAAGIAAAAFTGMHHHGGQGGHPLAAGLTDAPAAVRVAGSGEAAFIRAVLADLGVPRSRANRDSLAAWFPREFPSWPPAAENNPMATTMTATGSTVFNSAGVRNYPTSREGAQVTAQTLDNGHYPGMIAALRAGRGLCGGGFAAEFSVWSNGGYQGVC